MGPKRRHSWTTKKRNLANTWQLRRVEAYTEICMAYRIFETCMPWFPLVPSGSLWALWFRGFPWFPLGPSGLLWYTLGRGSSLGPFGSLGAALVPMSPNGFRWFCLGSSGPILGFL